MLTIISGLFNDTDSHVRGKAIAILSLLVGANILVWLWALLAFRDHPTLLGTAFLAYTFGLRHAVDADHIAAIDNVTRKLMQEGKRPVAVGFFFSMGHATLVILMSAGVALAAAALQTRFSEFKQIGGVISTCVSATFLFVIAFANALILTSVYRTFQTVKRGGRLVEDDMDMLLNGRGLLARLFGPLFRMVRKSWHLFPIGLLFGLGFDTASEIALFGISGAQASNGMSLWSIMVFPALFTAGMSLVDTLDGILMLGAYGWAFMKPIRKLYYNMTITFVSVVMALAIGGVETLGLIGDKMGFEGWFWDDVALVNGNFGVLGYVIIGVFLTSWLASMMIYRLKGYDRIAFDS